ncbi:hypothetical protein [Naasia lichenicola]|uniref:FtsX-like permease family protein n=1 Tax=Naasia lichenicola TaxID=2565933 RepID=A0A4S4FT63_9MICO|nr:hypothetical protein [Naasia lichenicola]THG33518.1 hypothetical protein E6C64_04060 [Naasia lichenicola]
MSGASSFGSLSLARRISRRAAGPLVAIALLALVASAAATAGVLVVGSAMTAAVRYDLDTDAAPAERQLTATALGGPQSGPSADPEASGLAPAVDAVWGDQQDRLAEIRDSMPSALRQVTDEVEQTTVFPEVAAAILPGARPAVPTELALGVDPRLDQRVELVDGEWPAPFTTSEGVDIVLSVASANAARWQIGDVRSLSELGGIPTTVRLSGIFQARDAADPYWTNTSSVLEPSFRLSPDGGTIVIAQGYVDASSWPVMPTFAGVASTSVWFGIDRSRITTDAVPAIQRDIRRFTGQAWQIAPATEELDSSTVRQLRFSTDAADLFDRSLARNAVTADALALLGSGPFAAALAALFLAARLLGVRLAPSIALLRARGGSLLRIRGTVAGAIALWVLPATVVGVVAGALFGDSFAARAAPSVGAGAEVLGEVLGGVPVEHIGPVAGIAAGIALAVALVTCLGSAAVLPISTVAGSSRGARGRVLVEVAIVLLAVLLLVLTGLTGSPVSGSSPTLDPLLAVLPVSLASVAVVLALGIGPALLGGLLRAGRRRRGLFGLLGAARAVRGSVAVSAGLAALVMGISVALFSGALLSTLESGIDEEARATVGADIAVAEPAITPDGVAELAELPGVASAAGVASVRSQELAVGQSTERITVLVVPVAELQRVQRGVPGAVGLPAPLAIPAGAEQAVPVLLSDRAADLVGDAPLALGGRTLDVLGVVPGVSPLTSNETWILVDAVNADAILGQVRNSDRVLLRRTDADGGTDRAVDGDLLAAIADARPNATVSYPAELTAARRGSPLVAALQTAVLSAALGAGLLCAAAVVMTLALGAGARRRVSWIVGAFGAPRTAAGALAAWEVGPSVAIGLLTGVLTGVALPYLVLPRVGLRLFTGGVDEPAIALDPSVTAAMVGGFALLVGATVAIAAWTAGRRQARPGGPPDPTMGAAD